MKFSRMFELLGAAIGSLPVRGAWIEMSKFVVNAVMGSGRSPCGERGLKYRRVKLRRGHIVAPRAGSVD